MRLLFALITFSVFLACTRATRQQAVAPASAPRVVLKLDDLTQEPGGGVHEGWRTVVDLLDERGVPASIGLICSSLEAPTDRYLDWIAARRADGHEFWNHGYCHCRETLPDGSERREFRGPAYPDQLTALVDGQRLARERLGFSLTAFGAPYNSTDSATAAALGTMPEFETWLYKDTDHPTALRVLPRTPVNIEYPVHVPDFERFRENYLLHRDAEVLVLQGHPRSWVKEAGRMEAFVQIVDFLLADGAEVVRVEDL